VQAAPRLLLILRHAGQQQNYTPVLPGVAAFAFGLGKTGHVLTACSLYLPALNCGGAQPPSWLQLPGTGFLQEKG